MCVAVCAATSQAQLLHQELYTDTKWLREGVAERVANTTVRSTTLTKAAAADACFSRHTHRGCVSHFVLNVCSPNRHSRTTHREVWHGLPRMAQHQPIGSMSARGARDPGHPPAPATLQNPILGVPYTAATLHKGTNPPCHTLDCSYPQKPSLSRHYLVVCCKGMVSGQKGCQGTCKARAFAPRQLHRCTGSSSHAHQSTLPGPALPAGG